MLQIKYECACSLVPEVGKFSVQPIGHIRSGNRAWTRKAIIIKKKIKRNNFAISPLVLD